MNYWYTTQQSDLWFDLMDMINENYYQDCSPNDLIVFGAHHFQTIDQIRIDNPHCNKIIIYQLEPLIEDHWWKKDFIISRIKDADEVWDYDLDNIKILKENGINAKFKPFVYTHSLDRIENKEDPKIDVFFYGTLTEHRSKILNMLSNGGYVPKSVIWSVGIYGKDLDEIIGNSKIILDLHTNDNSRDNIQKQSRIFYPIINNKCVISEKSKRNYFGDLIIESEIDNILETVDKVLKEEIWKNYSNISEIFKNI